MNLENFTLSERGQTQKATCCRFHWSQMSRKGKFIDRKYPGGCPRNWERWLTGSGSLWGDGNILELGSSCGYSCRTLWIYWKPLNGIHFIMIYSVMQIISRLKIWENGKGWPWWGVSRIMIDVIPRTWIPSPLTPQVKIKAKNAEYPNKGQWLRI